LRATARHDSGSAPRRGCRRSRTPAALNRRHRRERRRDREIITPSRSDTYATVGTMTTALGGLLPVDDMQVPPQGIDRRNGALVLGRVAALGRPARPCAGTVRCTTTARQGWSDEYWRRDRRSVVVLACTGRRDTEDSKPFACHLGVQPARGRRRSDPIFAHRQNENLHVQWAKGTSVREA